MADVNDTTEYRRRATDLHKLQLDVLQEIHEDLGMFSDREQSFIQTFRDQLNELRIIVIGTDGQNGLRSVLRKNSAEIESLKRWQTQFMAIFAVVQLGVPVAIYIITKLL